MKTVNFIAGIIIFLFLALSGLLFSVYILYDLIKGFIFHLKVNTDLQGGYIKQSLKTVYPDERLEFNDWAQYIYKQNNRN